MDRGTRCAVALLVLSAPVLAFGDEPVAGRWAIETARDAATYVNVTTLYQASTTAVSDEYVTKQVHPRLELRCEPGGAGPISVRIDWLRFISSFNTDVRFEADDAEPLTISTGVDRSNKITTTRSASDDERLLDYLAGRDALTVGVTPYSGAPLEVHYELAGFDETLATLQSACGGSTVGATPTVSPAHRGAGA